MDTRDKLSSRERFLEIIDRQREYIQEELVDLAEYNSEDTEEIRETYKTLYKYSLDNLLAAYSAGESLTRIKEEYKTALPYFRYAWYSTSFYVQMVWMLSIGIMLDVEKEDFSILIECVEKDNPNDFLIDFLIKSRVRNWQQHTKNKYPIPYKTLVDVILVSKNEALDKLTLYLQKEWYKGHSDTGWYNAHIGKWNIHTGYWSFESGALVKILDLDDSSLRGQQYYPYDMVHWKS